MLGGAAAARSLGGLEPITVGVSFSLLGISVACMLAALVLGQRTGPRILYARIFDRSPPAPPQLLVERPGRTAVRVVAPALALAVVLLMLAPVVTGGLLVFVGIPRADLRGQLPAALIVSGGWLLTASGVAFQVARYFEHWERWRGRTVLCRPLRAGAMRYVYLAGPGRGPR